MPQKASQTSHAYDGNAKLLLRLFKYLLNMASVAFCSLVMRSVKTHQQIKKMLMSFERQRLRYLES